MTLAEQFDNFWLYWIVAFIVIEGAALWLSRKSMQRENQGGTLSELVRRITKQNRLVKVVFIIFWIYLGLHFLGVPGF
mgnify:CR=1 FL=1